MRKKLILRTLAAALTICILSITVYLHREMEYRIENLTLKIDEYEGILSRINDIKLLIEKSYYNPLKISVDYFEEPELDIYYLSKDEELAKQKCSEINSTIKVNLYPLNNITNAYKLVNFLAKLRIRYPFESYSWAIFKYQDVVVFFRLEMVDVEVIQACLRIYRQ